MRVLLVHNFYRQPGGEDYVFRAEATVLTRNGHEVETFERSSTDATDSLAGVLKTALRAPWAAKNARALEHQIARFRPDIVHFHNIFPLISPAAYYACRRRGVPVVQTLHNYRLICPKADLYRAGAICETCVGRRFAWPAIRYRCYRDSRPGSAALAGMLALHHGMGTWGALVDRYIALTDFARDKMVAGGFPAERIVVKPNFLLDPPRRRQGRGDYAIFIGRLTEEKGLRTLMKAWEGLDIPLRILGGGPLLTELKNWAASRRSVQVEGRVDHPLAMSALEDARFFVLPSHWFEGFPIAVLEAMAAGVPTLASDHGSLASIVNENSGGLVSPSRDAYALSGAARKLWSDDRLNRTLADNAVETFNREFDEVSGLRCLVAMYEDTLETTAGSRRQ